MAGIDRLILERARRAVIALSDEALVVESYVFGSHLTGEPDVWSDIDIAAFLDGAESWDIERRANVSARIQRVVGDDIEIHLFPSSSIDSPVAGSFATYVRRTGLRIEVPEA